MANKQYNGDVNVEFTEAQSRQSLESGESVKTLFGKLRKWLTDLKAVAFSGSYNDLTNKPNIPELKQLTNEDLDDVKAAGFYNAGNSNTCTHKPSSITGSFGMVVVKVAGGDYWVQYYIPYSSSNKPYMRYCAGGTWGSWVVQDFASSSHNQAADTINLMTGYSKPATTGAISSTDTLNDAIGKLETALDGKASTSGGTVSGPVEIYPNGVSDYTQLRITQNGVYYGMSPVGVIDPDRRIAVKSELPNMMNNATMHNSIFRGLNLTNRLSPAELYEKIQNGDFSELFLGDYISMSFPVLLYTKFTGSSFVSGTTYYERSGSLNNWTYTATSDTSYDSSKTYYTAQALYETVGLMFAGFDYYYNTGDTALETHHAVLIPRGKGFSTQAAMNPTNTTVGGYYNSEMHQTTLPCYAAALKDALGSHILSHKERLSDQITASYASMAGSGFTGASSHAAMYNVELQLMSEPQVYGTMIWSSSANDVGIDNKILPVFNFINPVQYDRGSFWLRSVASSTNFARCHNNGFANSVGASTANYVRPLILIG